MIITQDIAKTILPSFPIASHLYNEVKAIAEGNLSEKEMPELNDGWVKAALNWNKNDAR